MTDTVISVIVPSWNEEDSLPACLLALFEQAFLSPEHVTVHVVVVANGCDDESADIARAMTTYAPPWCHLHVIEINESSKVSALNAGDAYVRSIAQPDVHAYVDADVVVSTAVLQGLASALDGPRPRCASPAPIMQLPEHPNARAYARVWRHLPSITADVVGLGCYAVNRDGRRRWTDFPPLIADDAYVRSRFARQERVTADGSFIFRFPDGPNYVDVLARWRYGNRQLRERHGPRIPASSIASTLRLIAATRAVWLDVPRYLLVLAAVRWRARTRPRQWARRPSLPLSHRAPAQPFLTAIVVTHNNQDCVGTCIAALKVAIGNQGEIRVIDSGSHDGTTEIIERECPDVSLRRHADNLGFAHAADLAAAECTSDYLLFVNPDTILDPQCVDALLQLARHMPDAGIYGGSSTGSDGRIDRCSCLARPSAWEAFTFATGLALVKGSRLFDPDSLGGWARDTVRAVPALAGTVLLVSRHAWNALGGFDTTFFLYGEDVDFCLRARAVGFSPAFTPAARYVHHGGGSSTPAQRMALILRGRATLYRRWLSPRSARWACTALVWGVALRYLGESVVRRPKPNEAVWKKVWTSRREWRNGWPSRSRSVCCRVGSKAH